MKRKFLLVCILLFSFIFCNSDSVIQYPRIATLEESHKNLSVIQLKLILNDVPLQNEPCRLIVTCDELESESKSFEKIVQSGDHIKLPAGYWKFRLIYKYGYSSFQSERKIESKKKYDLEISLESWIQFHETEKIGQFFTDIKYEETKSISKSFLKSSLQRLDFFTLPYKDSLLDVNKTFLFNPLGDGLRFGKIWCLGKTPIPVRENINYSFHYELFDDLNKNSFMSFYKHPTNKELKDTFLIKNVKGDFYKNYFAEHKHYYPSLAVSLIVDTLAGPIYDGLDLNILNEYDLELWYFLLNKGYRIPMISSSVEDKQLKTRNPYHLLHGVSKDLIEDKFNKVKSGALTISTGPLLLFQIDEYTPGKVLLANGDNHILKIFAKVSPSEWDYIKEIQIIRNGEIFKNKKLNKKESAIEINFPRVFEKTYSWYVVKVITGNNEIAISNPIYFEPLGYQPPEPMRSLIRIKVQEKEGGAALKGVQISVYQGQKMIKELVTENEQTEITIPINSRLILSKDGYLTKEVLTGDVLKLKEILCGLMTIEGGGVSSLTDSKLYEEIKAKLSIGFLSASLSKN